MRLNYSRMYKCIEGNSKIHDQTFTKMFCLPQSTYTILKKTQTNARKKCSYNPSENTFIFYRSFPSARVKRNWLIITIK